MIHQTNVSLPEAEAAGLLDLLRGSGLTTEQAGGPRGFAADITLVIVSTPSIAALALVFEKLRRLRLPRTYIQVSPSEIDVWTDRDVNDGRVFAVSSGGVLTELADANLTIEGLAKLVDRPSIDSDSG